MSVNSKFRRSGVLVLAALGCGAVLSACSSGSETKNEAAEFARGYLTERLAGRGKAGPPRVTADQARQVAAQSAKPVVLIDFAKSGSSALIVEIERNGPVQTFATSARQTVALQNGMARGTRGLGGDLMSVDLGGLPRLIARRQGGTTHREMRFLNGEDVTVRYRFTCSVQTSSPGPNSRMTETCSPLNNTYRFTNSYQIDGAGRVLSSEQWFGPELGSAKLQHVTH